MEAETAAPRFCLNADRIQDANALRAWWTPSVIKVVLTPLKSDPVPGRARPHRINREAQTAPLAFPIPTEYRFIQAEGGFPDSGQPDVIRPGTRARIRPRRPIAR